MLRPWVASIGRRRRRGERPGLESLEVLLPTKLDAKPCIEDHELSQRPVEDVDGGDWDFKTLGRPTKRLLLRDLGGSLSVHGGGSVWGIGEAALVEEEDAAGPSSPFGVKSERDGVSSFSWIWRRVRGRRVVELPAEAAEDVGLLMLIEMARRGLNVAFIRKTLRVSGHLGKIL